MTPAWQHQKGNSEQWQMWVKTVVPQSWVVAVLFSEVQVVVKE
jgi:hypothetical protein